MKNSIIKDTFQVALILDKRFIIKFEKYEDFGAAQFFFTQMGVKTKYKELEKQGEDYVAEFEIIGVYQNE